MSNRTLENVITLGLERMEGLPQVESSTGERGLGWGAGPHFGMCPSISNDLTTITIF